ncbi:hypothetical protein [Nostoc sp. JL33]|uniref:hypothetical protein n=1 Tax=Nostoc sp. JL33 TaxID=2815396 RepID=UPI0025CBB8D0|nr:hypothetical protein [Nostoc sp. JL33]MBN3870138.1 hypothetical protein [Nostoc sp. JL33]
MPRSRRLWLSGGVCAVAARGKAIRVEDKSAIAFCIGFRHYTACTRWQLIDSLPPLALLTIAALFSTFDMIEVDLI